MDGAAGEERSPEEAGPIGEIPSSSNNKDKIIIVQEIIMTMSLKVHVKTIKSGENEHFIVPI